MTARLEMWYANLRYPFASIIDAVPREAAPAQAETLCGSLPHCVHLVVHQCQTQLRHLVPRFVAARTSHQGWDDLHGALAHPPLCAGCQIGERWQQLQDLGLAEDRNEHRPRSFVACMRVVRMMRRQGHQIVVNIVMMAGDMIIKCNLSSYNIEYSAVAPMPLVYRVINSSKPRGVAARNKGIKWIVQNGDINGVMYFADDDIDCTIAVLEYLCWMVTFVICPQYDGCGIFWLLSLLRKRLGTTVDHLLYPGDGTCFLFLFSYSKNKHINKQKT